MIRAWKLKRTSTLRGQLVPAFFIAAVIPILIFAVISQMRLHTSMQENLNDRIQGNLDKADQCLEMALDKYATILYDLSTNDGMIEIVESINQNEDDLNVNSSTIRHQLSHICNRNDAVAGITLVTATGKTLFYDRLSSSSVNSTWANAVEVPVIEGGETYVALKEPVRTDIDDQFYIFQIARNLVDYRDVHKKLGTVILSVDVEILQNAVQSGERSQIYIRDGDTVICAPDKKDIGRTKAEIQAETEDIKVAERVNERSGWILQDNESLLNYKMTMMEQTFFWILIGIGTVLGLVALIAYFTNPLLKYVDTMVNVMNEIELGNFEARIPIDEELSEDITRIGSGFNEMVEKIDELIRQVKMAVTEQKNAEISALEAQIDPHFLYNTLDTINWKAIDNEQYEISEMIGALADILRYTVKNAGGETSIEMELAWLHEYTLLQGAKLGKDLQTEIEVPEELMQCRIHKLLLQPFVENAIKHGLFQKEGACILKIMMREAENQLHIIIEDNGKGISKETIQKLNDPDYPLGEHLGVDNVRKRLKLYYAEDAAIYFESEEGNFTKVHLFIPEGKEMEE